MSKPVIGILGGIGSGKSAVAAELARLGCGLIDADKIGHELLRWAEVKAQLRQEWGERVFDAAGEVDRAALGRRVFESPADLKKLNRIVHPGIRLRIMERIKELQADPAVSAIVLDAALLLETDWHSLCSHFVFVKAPGAERAARVAQGRGWDDALWRRRENSQKPLDMKAARADYVVDNNSSLACLRERVQAAYHRIVHAVS